MSEMTTITISQNGPYLVEGPVKIVDINGNEYPIDKKMVALCRCGGSTTKPFCDGTHSRIGFQGASEAVSKAA